MGKSKDCQRGAWTHFVRYRATKNSSLPAQIAKSIFCATFHTSANSLLARHAIALTSYDTYRIIVQAQKPTDFAIDGFVAARTCNKRTAEV